MFSIFISISAYESKVKYDRTYSITENTDGTYGLGDNPITRFNSVEECEKVIKFFVGLDFSYAYIYDENGTLVSTYYVRHNTMRKMLI